VKVPEPIALGSHIQPLCGEKHPLGQVCASCLVSMDWALERGVGVTKSRGWCFLPDWPEPLGRIRRRSAVKRMKNPGRAPQLWGFQLRSYNWHRRAAGLPQVMP
jgi:hypothetical protein